MPERGTVNRLEVSPHRAGHAYAAVYRYRRDDFTPYIFHTTDYGRSWEQLADGNGSGLALGAWGAVQATATGIAIAIGGTLRDLVQTLSEAGALGTALQGPAVGYSAVYHLEIALLFAAIVAIGPLSRHAGGRAERIPGKFGLADFPG